MGAKDLHSPWRDELLPASFDGNEFFMEVGSREGGNRLVVHQFPKKDSPYTENMGRRANDWRVVGYLIQSARRPDYRPARDALTASLEKGMGGKPAQLQLPTMKPAIVLVQTYRLTEEERLGGFCRFDMHFVEAGASPFKPTAAPGAQVSQKASALEAQTVSGMTSTGRPAGII